MALTEAGHLAGFLRELLCHHENAEHIEGHDDAPGVRNEGELVMYTKDDNAFRITVEERPELCANYELPVLQALKVADVGLGSIPTADHADLEASVGVRSCPLIVDKLPYGYLVTVPDFDDTTWRAEYEHWGMSARFVNLIQAALDQQFDYVKFDRDGPLYP